MKQGAITIALALTFFAIAKDPLKSQCVSSNRAVGQIVGYDAVTLIPVGLNASLSGAFKRGYGAWNAPTCNSTQFDGFPQFTEAAGSGRTVKVRYQPGFNPNNRTACGGFRGNDVLLYQYAKSQDGTRTVNCLRSDILEDTVAHELGHLLGLTDQSTDCNGFIMSQVAMTRTGDYIDRRVRGEECARVASTNQTPQEQIEDQCQADPNCARCNPPDLGCSPLLIDLDDVSFELTAPAAGTRFDIDADGTLDQIAWTHAGRLDGFLALDRNGNGNIDDGSELFGDSTPLPDGSRARNGFEALFAFDSFAGNQNGFIDPGDPIFTELSVWVDMDHDGRVAPDELRSLHSLGIAALTLEYRALVVADQHRNQLIFWGHVYFEKAGEWRRRDIVDVLFAREP